MPPGNPISPSTPRVGILAHLLMLCLLIATPAGSAQNTELEPWLGEAAAAIKAQEKRLAQDSPTHTRIEELAERLKSITPIKLRAQACIDDTGAQSNKLQQDLATLGEALPKEAAEITQKRRSLEREIKDLEKTLASCKLTLLQSQDLISAINKLQQDILAQRLSAHTPNIIEVLRGDGALFEDWRARTRAFFAAQEALSGPRLLWMIAMLVFGAAGGIALARMLKARRAPEVLGGDSGAAFLLSLQTGLVRYLPALGAAAAISVYLGISLPLTPPPFISQVGFGVGAYLAVLTLINILLSPIRPAEPYLTGSPELSRRFARRLKLLALLMLGGFIVFGTSFREVLTEPAYHLLRAGFATALIILLIALLWLVRRFSWATLSPGPRAALILILLGCLGSELAGYRNLSVYVLIGLTGTLFGLDIALLASRLFTYICDGLDESRRPWHARLRQRLGVERSGPVPGLIWVRMIAFILIWSEFVFWTLMVWDISEQGQALVWSYVTEGFEIGSLRIVPTLMLAALLTFAIALNLARFFKTRVLPRWLTHTRLDRGAREAVSSIAGYIGVAVAILVALSIAGVHMQNLALIAGALSLGIGFGLQNIVNNFISGIILLFERPIRRGDWIVTASTEGYVKSINIRSTQIETFDKADVIVPNSELISSQVTNWMLRDPWGRINVAVGVSYDADVIKVRDTLLEVAGRHPMVMTDHPSLRKPTVLFRRFGDSALEFELRCFIQDVEARLQVISDLNFAIVEAFRREGIEIPFPQRDIHIKSPGKTLPPDQDA